MANNKDIKKNKPKKEKKKRKPIYEIQGFVLTIPKGDAARNEQAKS